MRKKEIAQAPMDTFVDKSYKNKLELKAGIPAFDLIRSKPGHNGGTMVQRRFIFIVIINYL